MLTEESAIVFFSWEEFGQIVETIADQIEESVMCDSLISLSENSKILTLALAYRLEVPVTTIDRPSKNPLWVDLDNFTSNPHVAVTFFQRVDTENFALKDPRFYYRSSVIDTEGRKQEVIFPWQKA